MTVIHCWGQEIQLSLSAVASSGSLQRARQSLVLAAALIHFFFLSFLLLRVSASVRVYACALEARLEVVSV